MAKVIFKDSAHQALFDKQGYIVLPLLPEDEVFVLNALFDELNPNLSEATGFVSGSYSTNYAYKLTASNKILEIFRPHYDKLFIDYQPFGAAFLYKMPNSESELSIHQDWTIVDEEQYLALNCWVPLTDINAQNGALHIVPRTHYDKIKTIRCPTLPFFFSGNDDLMVQASQPLYIPAGHTVILNQSVIHYSPANRSNQIRKAITAGVKSKGAPMKFYYHPPSEPLYRLERFEMPEDFLIRFDNFARDISERPRFGESEGFIEFHQPQYSREQLLAMLETGAPKTTKMERRSFLGRITNFFSS